MASGVIDGPAPDVKVGIGAWGMAVKGFFSKIIKKSIFFHQHHFWY